MMMMNMCVRRAKKRGSTTCIVDQGQHTYKNILKDHVELKMSGVFQLLFAFCVARSPSHWSDGFTRHSHSSEWSFGQWREWGERRNEREQEEEEEKKSRGSRPSFPSMITRVFNEEEREREKIIAKEIEASVPEDKVRGPDGVRSNIHTYCVSESMHTHTHVQM